MAGWHHDNANWKEKVCPVCDGAFRPKGGFHKFCSEACKGKWKYITGQVTTASQYAKITGSWPRYMSRLLAAGGVKRTGLTREDLLKQLEKQNYRCALTGQLLTCELVKGVKSKTNASVDRIIAGGPYTPANIQLVCVAVNHFREETSVSEFIDWCRKVVAHADRVAGIEAAERVQGHG